MSGVVAFLNSGFGLLLSGSFIGAIALFTWQRRDWLYKQTYLRAQVILDRQLGLLQAINTDVGHLLATGTACVVSTYKGAGQAQRDGATSQYNQQQVEWFGSRASHQALLSFYFNQHLAEEFESRIVGAYEAADPKIASYGANPTPEGYREAYHALENIRSQMRSWNGLAFEALRQDGSTWSEQTTPS